MKIKLRIILIVIVPVLLGLIVSGAFSLSTSLNAANEYMDQQSDIVNGAYSDVLTQAIGKYTTQVEAIAREAGFFDADATEQDKVTLLQRHAATTDVKNIGIFGADGKNIFIAYDDGSIVPVGVADISSRSYLQEALGGKTVVFGPSKDVVTGRLTVTIATRALAPSAPSAIVAIDFDLGFINAVMTEAKFGDTGYSFVLDRDGMIISHPESALIGNNYQELAQQDGKYAGIAGVVKTMLSATGSGNSIRFELDEENYATYQPVEGTDGWILVSTAYVSEYLEDYNRSIVTQLAVLVIFLVVAVVFALFIGQRMAEPIRFASKRVVALSKGDLTQVSDPKASRRGDEIGELVRALDSAVDTLNSYVGDISENLGQMASGNLDVNVTLDYLGDFAPIKSSLQKITDALNLMMQDIRSAASQVASGSSQIAQASTNLATGSSQQAATIQDFSATLAQVSEMAEYNTRTASEALAENQKADSLMVECMEAMQQMTGAMQAINASSQDISRVIKVIDDIAFQTNILALNAAVEAARAGQHGKGFAVVADEVRNLAGKSAEAAKETTQLIEQSVRDAGQGTAIVARVGDSLQAVAEISHTNATQISDMDTGSRQQSDAMEKVVSGITQLNSVVQANSATAEETAASSEEMSAQAAMLNNIVAQFHVREVSEQPPARTVTPRPQWEASSAYDGFALGDSSKY